MRITARLSVSAVLTGLALMSMSVTARTYTFDATMLGESAAGADISLFNEGGQLPGMYTVTILLNGERVDNRDVVFSLQREEGKPLLAPCLSVEQLSRYGVRTEDFAGLNDGTGCAALSALSGANFDFNFGQQQLNLSIPQIHLRPVSRGLAPQALWDDGIPALLLNYSLSTSHSEYRDSDRSTTSSFAQLNPGINLGAWRLRSQSSWHKQGNAEGKWQTTNTYAERGLYGLRSTLTLGERTTEDPLFAGIPFRGVMLATDASMVPYNERAFAPIVRGIARTQARVEVRQNGYLLQETNVAPGPFALRDLPVGGTWGGDLQVTVRESDGSVQTFSLPYQAPAVAVREGYLSYNIMAGQYRPSSRDTEDATIAHGVIVYGLPHDLTVFGGMQGAEHYRAAGIGIGASLGSWGAASVDVIGARAQLRGQEEEEGAAWRMRYSKLITATNTTLTVAGYRHATPGFATLDETLNSYGDRTSQDGTPLYSRDYGRMRSSTSLSVSQTLGDVGSFGLTASRTDYWQTNNTNNSYSFSYSVGLPWDISLSLSQTETRSTSTNGTSSNDHLTSLSLSIPLGSRSSGSSRASYQGTNGSRGQDHSLGINGSEFNNRLNWDVRQSRQSTSGLSTTDNSYMHVGWRGAYGQAGTGYSYNSRQRTVSADASGGMILHQNGLTVGQSAHGTVVLVEAPDAAGVPVNAGSGVRTDFRGYAMHSSVTPYQENTVSIDPIGLSDEVEITQTDVRVVPTRGAVVPARFSTRAGGRALMRLTRPDGTAVPFGALATVQDAEGGAGVVGSEGEVYLTGLSPKGVLNIRWNNGQCRADYTLPAKAGTSGIHNMQATCR